MDYRFPAACRLKNAKDIQAVYARRDVFRGERLVFHRANSSIPVDKDCENSDAADSRYCLVVSKKCGHAAKRNRIKRLLREILRKNRFRIPPGYDFLIRAIPEALGDKVKQDDFLADFKTYYRWQ